MKNLLFNKDLISAESITHEIAEYLFEKTKDMKDLVEKKGGDNRLCGKIMAALFYEPSSRTFSSFITAIQRLGGGFIPLNGMKNTSVDKGETLSDTAKVFSSYADLIVLRHNEQGSAKVFAQSSSVPVINAGDGSGEHPTQALLDAFTIKNHFPDLSGLRIGLVGDLLYGRTVHSLSIVLSRLSAKMFVLISPDNLKMPSAITAKMVKNGADIKETNSLENEIHELDVIYMTRIQKERFENSKDYELVKNAYVLDEILMKKAKKEAVVMHPLPRINEIHEKVDSDRRALYFREQMENGLFMRMAILDAILRN